MNWQPIECGLPLPHQKVIVFGMKQYARIHKHVMVAWRTYDWEQSEFGSAEWEGRQVGFDVTSRPLKNISHWMPLPPPPKSLEKED